MIQIKETNTNTFLVNNKEVYIDQEGCAIERQPLTLTEKQQFHTFLEKVLVSKGIFKEKDLITNKLSVELIRYYQQREALEIEKQKGAISNSTYDTTVKFYDYKINSLRKQIDERDPEKLRKIDANRANDLTVNEAETL